MGNRLPVRLLSDKISLIASMSDILCVMPSDWPVYSPFAKLHYGKGLAEGQAEGHAEDARESVLAVLDARGLNPADSDRQRILASTDLNELKAWLRRPQRQRASATCSASPALRVPALVTR
jgi:hypothetical protein